MTNRKIEAKNYMYERNKDIENLKPYFEKFILPGNTKQKKEMVG